MQPDGRVGAVYRKMHLVPFGEYVPLQRLLFFVGPLVEATSDFLPGTEAVLLPVGSHRVSTAICYEVIFASLMRQFVVNGSELLTTITNDAWYGSSSAPYQHWDQAAMRAIEGGRYLARAANTGISGFVDPYGRVVQKTDLFTQAILIADLRFLTAPTIYSRIGDTVAWLSLAAVIAALLAAGGRGIRGVQRHSGCSSVAGGWVLTAAHRVIREPVSFYRRARRSGGRNICWFSPDLLALLLITGVGTTRSRLQARTTAATLDESATMRDSGRVHASGREPAPTVRRTLGVSALAFQLDEQLRRYEDLARRAGDLRSYL